MQYTFNNSLGFVLALITATYAARVLFQRCALPLRIDALQYSGPVFLNTGQIAVYNMLSGINCARSG